MALDVTVGGSTADSYDTVAAADAYHADFGNSSWTGTTGEKEAAMRRAAVWLDGAYRLRWPGMRKNGRLQARDWPQSGAADIEGSAIDPDTIPTEIKHAQFEAALVELVSPGSLSPRLSQSEVVKSEKIGPLAFEYDVGDRGVASNYPVVGVVERILSGIASSSEEYPAVVVI